MHVDHEFSKLTPGSGWLLVPNTAIGSLLVTGGWNRDNYLPLCYDVELNNIPELIAPNWRILCCL